MCTVTFIPTRDGCYITSNRDEKHLRKQAITPQAYEHNDALLTYPKDADAGGTWIAMKDNGDAAVLLNGAFIKHVPKPPYRKSRGLVFLDVFCNEEPLNTFREIMLHNIEPFTLIIYTDTCLYECRWDGCKKHSKLLDNNSPHIWSSATLYDDEVVARREQWFAKWLAENTQPTQQDILDFHRFGGEGDTHNDFRMNRDGKMFTVSITGISLHNDRYNMHYLDLQSNQAYIKETAVATNYLSLA